MSNETAITSLKEKIDDLNQQAWEVRVNDSPKAFELSQESIKLARRIEYPKGLAEGLRSLGFAYVRLFKNDEAATLLRESLSLFQSINDLEGQAAVYEYLGIIERNSGNLGHSLELLLKAYDLIKQTGGSKEIEITSCYQIGVTYKHLGNHDSALDYLYQALSLSKEIDLPLMEAYATNIIGSIYFDNGDYAKALECYQQGLGIRRQSNDKWGEAGSLDNIGFAYLKLDDLDKAIDYCKQSLAISQSTDDKKGEANALLHLAEIYQQAGDVTQASKFSNESLEIRKARGDRRGEAEVLLFLAGLHKNISDVENVQVNEWLSGALNIAAEIKAQDLLSKAYYNLHEYYSQKGNYKESLAKLEAHLHIEKELHKNTINQKVSNLEISHKAEVVSRRNKELTELNEKIEKANEELKIETSLERVRAVAMGMKEPADMINVCRMISDQIQLLGFEEIRNVQTVIIYPHKHEYLNYQYFTPYDKDSIEIIDYRLHPDVLEFTNQMLASADAYYTKTFEGEELKIWREYRKQTNQLPDPKLDEAASSHYYFYSIGSGALGVTTYARLSEKEISLFKRFRNVFELAYRRFVDIENAQAQAREAQIEAALERVRASSMAMHHSDDLIQVINVVKEQLTHLDIHFHAANFVTGYGGEGYTMWLASPGEAFPEKIFVPQLDQKLFSNVTEAAEKGQEFITYSLSFGEKNIYFKHLFENTVMRNTSEENKRFVFDSKGMASSAVLLKNVRFNLMNLDLISYTEEENNIIRRIAYVFEQSYIRFLDLQKAEAQAREAQIEAALERVRSRTMAMHKSEELSEVIEKIYNEFQQFGSGVVAADLMIITPEVNGYDMWVAGTVGTEGPYRTSGALLNHPHHLGTMQAWKRGDLCRVTELKGELYKSYFELILREPPGFISLSDKRTTISIDRKSSIRNLKSIVHTEIFGKYSCIRAASLEKRSEEQIDIQKRFARVFEQTYTRFLDLQKAEAQTRESQIELGLERVRARAMAMQNSDELKELIGTVYTELTKLDLILDRCFIMIYDTKSMGVTWWMSNPEAPLKPIGLFLKYHEQPPYLAFIKGWKERNLKWQYILEGEVKKTWDKFLFVETELSQLPDFVIANMKANEKVYLSASFNNFGSLTLATLESLSDEHFDILLRFAKVFDLTYTRFNDLKQAEAQAREAQIEAALERVRAKVMAMTNSKELNETSLIFGEQLRKLGIDWQFSYFWLVDEAKNENVFWITWPDYKTSFTSYTLAEAEQYFNDCLVSWRAGVKIHDNYVPPDGVQEWLDTFQRIADDAGGRAKEIMVFDTFASGVYYYDAIMKYGSFGICISKPATDEEKNIQCRFAIEFERAYTRFLDLKNAEAQAREAQIELALERVRARTMAMHKSEELGEAAVLLYKELKILGVTQFLNCGYVEIDEENNIQHGWMTKTDGTQLEGYTIPLVGDDVLQLRYDAWKRKDTIFYQEVAGNKLKNHTEFTSPHLGSKEVDEMVRKQFPDPTIYYCGNFSHGYLHIITGTLLNADEEFLLIRFTRVFEMTYKRFLDLQKAEAQAREAKIEAALERTRTQSMLMQHSKELDDTLRVFHEQVLLLGINSAFSFLWLPDENKDRHIFWAAWAAWAENKSKIFNSKAINYPLDRNEPATAQCLIDWKSNEPVISYHVPPASVKNYFAAWQELIDGVEHLKPEYFSGGLYYVEAFMKYGCFGVMVVNDLADDEKKILGRFAVEFERTYTRFLDLQKAEAQAREAQIEAALEKIRSRSLAMHKSDELKDVVSLAFEKLKGLNVTMDSACILTFKEGTNDYTAWAANPDLFSVTAAYIPYAGDSIARTLIEAREKGDSFISKTWSFEEKNSHWEYLFEYSDWKYMPAELKNAIREFEGWGFTGPVSKNSATFLVSYSEKKYSDQEKEIIKRLGKVFDQAYIRFLDLQKAEAQTREALIEAALERVRARALAMQQPEELKDVAEVLRYEMGLLGVEELETCSIYINDVNAEKAECWYALKDIRSEEKKLVNDHFALNLNDTWVGREMLRFYNSPEMQTSIVMTGTNRIEWIKYCEGKSAPLGGYYGEVIPDRTYHLYKFSHGAIGAAAVADISTESWGLLKRAASTFSLAYSRFKDLTQARTDLIKLKEEKKRAEDALTELKATQTQLVQTEKMASLGELTAGIAHEIQNPLNFVNNFSDVSNELLEEMKGELATGNMESAMEIAKDVKDNLEKILHHGKRADAIVKSMLQHSRSSTGKKEATDINALTEEYFRLAFHGLRAKDKSFNAKFETDLDKSIDKINIVPQEMGRVILNLINNAFYAVNEKKNKKTNGYEPLVVVTTKKLHDKIEIKVKDNGDGIPQKVLEKIFQPFFTTKPTGQGTGLGLSLSYDIITKGHGGELLVKTKEGEGAEFIISLPVN